MWQGTRVSEGRETGPGTRHLPIARVGGGPGEKLKEGHKGASFKYSDQARKGWHILLDNKSVCRKQWANYRFLTLKSLELSLSQVVTADQ